MARAKYASVQKVASIVRDALGRGATVDIDGLGSFRKIGKGYRFQAVETPRIFVAYAHEDAAQAGRIYDTLLQAGFNPWMDERKLLPGQNWARAIRNAIDTADFVVACFSQNSIHKRGGFQAEMRYAMESARRLPLDEIYLLPVRLDECPVPVGVSGEMQYVDFFPDWEYGVRQLIKAVRHQLRQPSAA